MKPQTSSERLGAAMERTRRQWQARRLTETGGEASPGRSPAAFTIALSRQAGADGLAVARAVGERLDWPVYDRELLKRVGEETGLHASLLEGVDETRRGWLQEALLTFTSRPAVNQSFYVRHLLESLLALAANGECLIVGRGAAQVLPPATTLRVRLVAPLADRVATIRGRLGLTEPEAARWVAHTDEDRIRFVRDHFHKDPTDPVRYDLVLNTARLTVAECADLIVATLNRLQARTPAQHPAVLVR